MVENFFHPPASRLCLRTDASAAAVERGRQLATELDLPIVETAAEEAAFDAVLVMHADRLELREPVPAHGKGRGGSEGQSPPGICCDFVGGAFGHRIRKGHVAGEALVKAVRGRGGSRGMSVVDATAGLGRDAVLLALAGFKVTAIERSPIIAALLRDGLERAQAAIDSGEAAELTPLKQPGLDVVIADARNWLKRLASAGGDVDVVVLDPMFPPRTKSALVKKEMRLCGLVVGGDDRADELLSIARQVARRRVVVKRPLHAAYLGQLQPTTSRKGKSVRFDIYARL